MIASLIIPNPTLISCCLLHVFTHFIRKLIFFSKNFFLCVFRGCMISFFSDLFCPNYFQLFQLFSIIITIKLLEWIFKIIYHLNQYSIVCDFITISLIYYRLQDETIPSTVTIVYIGKYFSNF